MANEKIIVVEDEKVIARDISTLLKKMGYSVPAIASNSDEALARVSELQPDLVLMDIVLKGDVDGVETSQRIRNMGIPVIFLTAYADDETLQKAKLTEPLAYVLKPFEEQDLHSAIEIALYRHKVEVERQTIKDDQLNNLQQEAKFFQRFANVKDKLLNNLIRELSDPFSSLSMVIQLLMESPLGTRYAQYLEILKTEFTREMKLVDQVARLQDLLTPENVGFLDEFSLLSIESKGEKLLEKPITALSPEPVRITDLSANRSLNKPLNQTELAKRLGVVVSAISYWKLKPGFPEWARSKDPDGQPWEYSSEVKLFYPRKA